MSITGRVTTSASLRENRQRPCEKCGERDRLLVYRDGHGWMCPSCDPKKSEEPLIRVVDPPAGGEA